jgi:lipopolysaccharide export LptBFGC system permease protein LptF
MLDTSGGATQVLKRVIDFTRINSMTNIRVELNPLIMLPFAALLLSIALAPLILRHHWERHYHKLCLGLAALTSYYVFAIHSGTRVLHAALEYVNFMVVVGSFFVVAGGIHLRVRGQGRPALKYAFSARRRSARKHHRHDRRVDVADPPVDRDEPK